MANGAVGLLDFLLLVGSPPPAAALAAVFAAAPSGPLCRMKDNVSRRLRIGQKQVIVLDDLFLGHDIASFFGFLERLPYRLNDIDSEETSFSRHWKAELPIEMALGTPVLKECVRVTQELFGPERTKLKRAHSNMH